MIQKEIHNLRSVRQQSMDETLEDSFPASDPPSWSSPQHEKYPEKQLKQEKNETRGRPDEVHRDFTKADFMPHESRTGGDPTQH